MVFTIIAVGREFLNFFENFGISSDQFDKCITNQTISDKILNNRYLILLVCCASGKV